MNRVLFAGLFTEGSTDIRFLEPIVSKTLNQIAFECKGEIELELKIIEIDKTDLKFTEQVLAASKKGVEQFGIMLLCVHTDADGKTDTEIWENKIIPAKEVLTEADENEYCKTMVALVPITMTESWILADTDLLKKQVGTKKADSELGLQKSPEEVNNPKQLIEDIIRATELSKTKRRRKLSISDLYQIIGQSLEIEKLKDLTSYQKFEEELRVALKELNFL